MGLCFSYAAEILPNRDGRVVAISKQVQITGSEGSCWERKSPPHWRPRGRREWSLWSSTTRWPPFGGVAGLEDEVFDGYAGLIYGTGVNTCYSERRENIAKLSTPWPAASMLINMESGGFCGVPRDV